MNQKEQVKEKLNYLLVTQVSMKDNTIKKNILILNSVFPSISRIQLIQSL